VIQCPHYRRAARRGILLHQGLEFMSSREAILFSPLIIGPLEIAGRVVKTSTSETRATAEGVAGPQLVDFYEPIAAGGTPLIITGNIYTSRGGQSTPNQMGADEDAKIAGLAALTRAVHRHGSRIFAQLSHAGRQVVPAFVGLSEAVSASDVKELTIGTRPRPLTIEEIGRIVEEFGEAARRCREAGFDGVQVHAGHGYLISQFLTPYTNRRTDGYGGSPENRMRLLREVHRAIRARTGPDFPVILKLNGDDALPLRAGLGTAALVEIARQLEADGIDAVEVSVGQYESGFPVVRGTFGRCLRGMVDGSVRFLPPLRRTAFSLSWPLLAVACDRLWPPSEGYNLRFAQAFKAALSIPVICVGGFHSRARMEAAIAQGQCDAVSCGRAFIADPFLFRHLRAAGASPECVYCNACVGRIGSQALDCFHPEVRALKDAMLERERASRAASAFRETA
jgi:2,4-dienoyl-CoA reductase-like NADH-dependent reductase (Old Yellow Enzyme family)